MHQLYKKIGFLIVFLMICGGVRGQINPPNSNICTVPGANITFSTSAFTISTGNDTPTPSDDYLVSGCSCDPSNPMPININYTVSYSYSLGNNFITSPFFGQIEVFTPLGTPSTSTAVVTGYNSNCGFGFCSPGQGNIRRYKKETLNVLASNLSLPYSALGLFTVNAKTLKIRVSISSSVSYGSLNNRNVTYFYNIYPPKPVVLSTEIKESCDGGATGTAKFNIRAYNSAKVYLTKVQMPLTFTVDTILCNRLTSPDYPFCTNTSPPIPSPEMILVDNTVGSSSGIITDTEKTFVNLSSGNYYLTIVNIVPRPFLAGCFSETYPITIEATPIMQGIAPINNITTYADEASYPNAIATNPNPYIKLVCVPNNVPGNQLFIEDIRRATGCNTMGYINIRGTMGVAPFTVQLERTYLTPPVAPSTTPVPNTQNLYIPPQTLPFTFAAGHTVGTPRYNWTGTLSNLEYGEYKVTVTDACGQSFINTFTIKENLELIALAPTPASNLAMPINGTPASTTNAFVVKNPTCIDASGNTTGEATISLGVLQNIASYQIGNTVRPLGLRDARAPGSIYWRLTKTSGVPMTSFTYKHASGSPLNALGGGNTTANFGNASYGDPVFSGRLGYEQCIISFSDLSLGDYSFTVGVYGMKAGTCVINGEIPSITYTFTITAPLPVDLVRNGAGEEADVTVITCRAVPNGTIRVKGTGNPEGYAYTLLQKNAAGVYVLTPTLGVILNGFCTFSGLDEGFYKVSIKRGNDTNCTDEYLTQPIEITTPPAFAFTDVVKLNISCNGFIAPTPTGGDGSITATIAGGTRGVAPTNTFSYKYQLQPLLLGNYVTTGTFIDIPLTTTTFTIADLEIGNYKIKIRDGAGCETFLTQNGSEIFEIINPAPLAFNSVIFNNVVCFGDIATISPNVSGGTPFATGALYELYYSLNGSATRVPFTAATPLVAGSYTIFVKDSRGCELAYTGAGSPFVVRPAISSALAVASNVPLVNGYAITCFGGDDGKIRLTTTGGVPFATGGNYSYQLNANAPVMSSLPTYEFTRLIAGTYTVIIKDSYGCTQTVR